MCIRDRYYSDCETIPAEVCLPYALPDLEELEALLQRWRGKRVFIHCPVRGDKKRLVDLAMAKDVYKRQVLEWEAKSVFD